MNKVNKIVSLFLLAFLLLSVSGTKMHIHYCSHSQALFAELNWVQGEKLPHSCENSNLGKSCCNSQAENSQNSNCHEPAQKSCNHCNDFTIQPDVDHDYWQISTILLEEAAEIELFQASLIYEPDYFKQKFSVNTLIFHPPPEAKLTCTWRC
ncbi:MAG: hypothetical protein K9H49_15900 [Bacteroidales bacterium]|nr:hypothetical protein [Bacteroidales bacterium]